MNARQALVNFHNHMVNLYGEEYREVWTEDDKLTAEILERRASKATYREETNFLRRFKGHRIESEFIAPAERKAAWDALVKKNGTGIVGRLKKKNVYASAAPAVVSHSEEDAYYGEIPIAGTNHSVVFKAPVTDPEPENPDSAAWLLWRTRNTA